MAARYKENDRAHTQAMKSQQSIELVLLERRRLKEEWCRAEAQCVVASAKPGNIMVFNGALEMCLKQ